MKTLTITLLSVALLAIGLPNVQAQTTATWIGPTNGDWNTDVYWDTGLAPADSTTNALIGPTNILTYNAPMVAASFGALTNRGVLSVNAAGFNNNGIFMLYPGGTGKLYVNNGGVVNVTGNMGLMSNSVAVMNAGSSVTLSGTLYIGSGTNGTGSGGTVNCLAAMTNNGGYLSAAGVGLNSPNGSVGNGLANLFVINGGTNNLGNVYVGRASGSSMVALGREGLVINGGLVNMTSLLIGNNAWGCVIINSGAIVTNTGDGRARMFSTTGRPARLYQNGGLFVTAGINYLAPSNAATAATAFAVNGGTNYSGGFYFGDPLYANIGQANFTNAATVYVGSSGIASNGAVTVSASLNNGGLFGATADWTGAAPMILNGVNSVFTFQAADADGTARNIILTGGLSGAGNLKKTGAGTLTLNASNSYAGSTLINTATLALGANGSLASSPIVVGSGATFDVSAVTGGYLLNGNLQTLSGFGSVNGTTTVTNTGTIDPGTTDVPGTLTFLGDVVEPGGAINHFDLSGDPSGTDNDFVVINGILTVSATNTVEIGGAPQNKAVYKLFEYGTFNGDLTNFTTSGGTLSNSVANRTIYLVALSTNHPPTNVVWLGNPTANNWDMLTTTNWSINGTGPATNFVTGDKARFDSTGAANPLVNIIGKVKPASVTVDATSDYTFSTTSAGTIVSSGGLTKTNSGTLTILMDNSYSGPTVIGGGVLAVTNLANGSTASPIGSANVDPANLVFRNGTLRYEGSSMSTDRGATLITNSTGTINVTNGDTTLTLSGTLTGPGTLVKTGPGKLILSGGNSYGSTVASNGILQINTSISALGSGAIDFVGGGVSLNVSSQQIYNNPINVITSGTLISAGGRNNVLSGAWSGSGTLNVDVGNSTSSYVTINTDMTTNFTGTIAVSNASAGFFRFNSGGGSGGPQQCNGSSTATFDLGNSSVILLNRNGGGALYGNYYLGALFGGTNTVVRGSANSGSPSTYLIGGKNINSTFTGKITDGLGGTGATVGITKIGTATLTLDGGINLDITTDGFNYYTNLAGSSTNLSYSGPTIISNGVLRLVAPVTLTNAGNYLGAPTPITLASASVVLDGLSMGYCSNEFDTDGYTVTNIVLFTNGVFEIAPNQALMGIGTILASNVLADANSQVNPGLPLGNLNVSQKIELAGAVNMSVNAASSPNCSTLSAPTIVVDGTPTLTVTNLGPEVGATFQLFNQAVTGFVVNLPTLTGTNSWVNNLAVNGSITLIAPPPPSTPPVLTNSFDATSGQLTLSWGEEYKGLYRLLAQTNTLSAGLTTNWVEWAGSSATNKVVITVDQTRGTVFFRLVYQ